MIRKDSQPFVPVPLRWVGPIKLSGPVVEDEVEVPLATFETPLWPSVNRGARVSVLSGGIRAVVVDERMTRSVLLETDSAEATLRLEREIRRRRDDLAAQVRATSAHARLVDFHTQIVGNLLYLRLELTTGDAAGHNMVTKAADRAVDWILQTFPDARYVSISGNYCVDKKPSAVNGILGRGRYVVAELTVPGDICRSKLRVTPQQLVDLNLKKNLLGGIVAGSVRTANAHFANMLLAFYLATGQDAANIVEGSQGIVHAETRDDSLYFSVTLPNLILGTVGSGKEAPGVRENLARLGCREAREAGENARRLAVLAAATVLCGELSLLAAQANPGELMRVHEKLERR